MIKSCAAKTVKKCFHIASGRASQTTSHTSVLHTKILHFISLSTIFHFHNLVSLYMPLRILCYIIRNASLVNPVLCNEQTLPVDLTDLPAELSRMQLSTTRLCRRHGNLTLCEKLLSAEMDSSGDDVRASLLTVAQTGQLPQTHLLR